MASLPRLYGDGYELELRVESWGQPVHTVTFMANGAQIAHRLKMLSLGDSFTSGEGETDGTFYLPEAIAGSAPCHVGTRSYPFLLSVKLGIAADDIRSVACAGAQIGDITGDQQAYWGQASRIKALTTDVNEKEQKQIDALQNFQQGVTLQKQFIDRYNPELVTIGIGGNDAGLMGKLQACVAPGTCEWAEGDGVRKTYAEIARLYTKLGDLFASIRERSPDTRVLVVGYPDIMSVDGACSVVLSSLLNTTERVFMSGSLQYLNKTIRAAAERAGFLYADIEQSYGSQKLCGGSTPVAMNGIRYGDDITVISSLPMTKIVGSETFHPTPTGHSLVATSIFQQYPNVLTSVILPDEPGVEPPLYEGYEHEKEETQAYQSVTVRPAKSSNRFKVSVPEGSLMAGSAVRIEIHSGALILKDTFVGSTGGVDEEMSLPDSVPDGYHTVHVYGQNRVGDLVDLYQFVTIDRLMDGSVTNVVGDTTGDVYQAKQTDVQIARSVAANVNETDVIPQVGVLGVTNTSGIAKQKQVVAAHLNVDTVTNHLGGTLLWWIIGGGVIMMGVVTVLCIFLHKRWVKERSWV